MRFFDFMVAFVMLVLAVAVVQSMLPTYTIQKTNQSDSIYSGVLSWQTGLTGTYSAMSSKATAASNPLDQAAYYLWMIVAALTSIIGLLSMAVFCYPMLTIMFPIPTLVAGIIQAGVLIAGSIALYQILRGGTTKWNE
jgi:hypothetical protein